MIHSITPIHLLNREIGTTRRDAHPSFRSVFQWHNQYTTIGLTTFDTVDSNNGSCGNSSPAGRASAYFSGIAIDCIYARPVPCYGDILAVRSIHLPDAIGISICNIEFSRRVNKYTQDCRRMHLNHFHDRQFQPSPAAAKSAVGALMGSATVW